MTLNRVFIAFMAALGLAVGIVLAIFPEARTAKVPPYFWVLIAMLIFDLATYARGRGVPGTMVTMDVRAIGFIVAIVLMVAVPILAGSPGKLF